MGEEVQVGCSSKDQILAGISFLGSRSSSLPAHWDL